MYADCMALYLFESDAVSWNWGNGWFCKGYGGDDEGEEYDGDCVIDDEDFVSVGQALR